MAPQNCVACNFQRGHTQGLQGMQPGASPGPGWHALQLLQLLQLPLALRAAHPRPVAATSITKSWKGSCARVRASERNCASVYDSP